MKKIQGTHGCISSERTFRKTAEAYGSGSDLFCFLLNSLYDLHLTLITWAVQSFIPYTHSTLLPFLIISTFTHPFVSAFSHRVFFLAEYDRNVYKTQLVINISKETPYIPINNVRDRIKVTYATTGTIFPLSVVTDGTPFLQHIPLFIVLRKSASSKIIIAPVFIPM